MANAVVLHRTQERRHLGIPIRVERLEEDQDVSDFNHNELVGKIDKMNARLLGMILSSTGAAIAFTLNIIVRH